ncbi:MAG: DUF4399 domain-containing protein [Vicinamibacterales bacterium]|nr:DUF4399 domain-containing protein [Vicinamibacterales bacterium]
MQTLRVRMMGQFLPVAAFMVAASACGGSPPPPPAAETAPAAAPAPAPAEPAKPRVFFMEPKNGATVKSPVHLVFGIEGYQIQPVPQGTVAPEAVRAGIGHHHLGIDQDCLPAGTTIVKGTPSWVHFGTGNNTIDTQLEPGPHKLTLQLGDDLHRTVDSMCETINITVEK